MSTFTYKARIRLAFFPSQQNGETLPPKYSNILKGKKCQLQILFYLSHEICISKCRRLTRHILFECKNRPASRRKNLHTIQVNGMRVTMEKVQEETIQIQIFTWTTWCSPRQCQELEEAHGQAKGSGSHCCDMQVSVQ